MLSSDSCHKVVPSVHITCHPGLEPFLQQEILTILQRPEMSLRGNRVHVPNMTQTQLFECCLRLGCATQISVPLLDKPLQCRGFAELERKLQQLPWNNWISNEKLSFQVQVSCQKSRLYHTAAIAERIQRVLSTVVFPSADEGPVVALQAQLHRDQLQLFLDARSFPLHQRGYRLETGKAPLREDLAYAMLWSAGLHSFDAVLDPFCGSGTLVLEAAAMLNGLPPGRLHDAPFYGTFLQNDKLWTTLKEKRYPCRPVRVAGSDRDAGVIKSAQANAVRAGVEDLVTLQQGAFSSHPWLSSDIHPQNFLWISNLPFGKRTTTTGRSGRVPALLPLYQTLVQHIHQTKCTAVLLTDNRSLLRRCGILNETELFQFFHGGIPVSVVRVHS
jgi:putative N6-adenine-specific DNA methylase